MEIQQELRNHIDDVAELANLLKNQFVAKDELVEMMVISAIAQEHLLLVGPPGTAKSELVKRFALYCSPPDRRTQNGQVPYFEYLLTRFTEPNEIFGPVDIQAFQRGGGHYRLTAGMLPQAEIAFLDEVFKANSAILNALLTVLNERTFYNGGQAETVPLLFAIGATNEIPDDSSLAALYDRFLVRVWTDNVEDTRFNELFERGWTLERERIRMGYRLSLGHITTTEALRDLYQALNQVDMEAIGPDYREVVRRIRAEGIELSDRRVIKLLKLVAAAALRRHSLQAGRADFWVLKHVWNEPEQIAHLENILADFAGDFAEMHYSAERELQQIADDVVALQARQNALRTEADFGHFLQETGRLRSELGRHSDEAGRRELLEKLEELIETALGVLEEGGS